MYLASFFVPFIIIFFSYAIMRITPFGDQTLLISDAQELYLGDLAFLKRMLMGEEDLLYTFEVGFGMPLVGLLTYMINPSNLIVLGFDMENFPAMYSLLTAINFSICGLTMYIFLSSAYGKSHSNLIFSTVYALIGFNVANCFNYNFFVDVELLPLVALGIKRIIIGRSAWLYLATLSFSIFSSFYFGFFLCVASVVVFLMFFAEIEIESPVIKKLICLKYAAASLLAGLLPAFFWIPALFSFLGGRAEQNSLADFQLSETMTFAEFFAKLFSGTNNPFEIMDGKPNIYCGSLVIFLVIFYFVDRRNSLRLKIIRAIPLAFYFVTFYVKAISMVMNGLTSTNWFNYRYSFVFSFLLILIACEQFQKITKPAREDLIRSCLIFASIVLVTFSQKFNYVQGGIIIYDLLVLIISLIAIGMTWKDDSLSAKELLIPRLFILCIIQSIFNFTACTKQLMGMSMTIDDFSQEVTVGKAFSKNIKTQEAYFRRSVADPTPTIKLQAPRIYGYDGSNYFGSGEKTFIFEGFGKLGMNWWRNRMWYPKGMPESFDSLLGIQNVLSQLDLTKSKGYIKQTQIGSHSIYQNPHALPISLLAPEAVHSIKLTKKVFENHNNIWKTLTGQEHNVFILEPSITFTVHANHNGLVLNSHDAVVAYASVVKQNDVSNENGAASGSRVKKGPRTIETPQSIVNSGHYIECSFIARHTGNYYSNPIIKDPIGGTVDRETTDGIRYLGYFQKGERVTDFIAVKEKISKEDLLRICAEYTAAYSDASTLASYAEMVSSRSGRLQKITDSHLTGSVSVDRNSRLLFTIPFDSGWKIFIDGKETKPDKSIDLFISCEIKEGTHFYELKYFPTGMKVSSIVTLFSLFLLLIFTKYDSKFNCQILQLADRKKQNEFS